jgi:hypothetical protein
MQVCKGKVAVSHVHGWGANLVEVTGSSEQENLQDCTVSQHRRYSQDGGRPFLQNICERLPEDMESHLTKEHSSEDNSLNCRRREDLYELGLEEQKPSVIQFL